VNVEINYYIILDLYHKIWNIFNFNLSSKSTNLLGTNIKNMRFPFILLVTLLWAQSGFSQTKEDVVYKNDGGILRGLIIEETDTQVKIQTKDYNVFVVSKSDIEKRTKEFNPSFKEQNSGKVNRSNRLMNHTEFGYGNGLGEVELYHLEEGGYSYEGSYNNDYNMTRITTINGMMTGKYVFLGVGLGLDRYELPEDNITLLPIYIHIRAYLTYTNTSPYVIFNTGYNSGFLEEDFNGGFMYNLGLGLSISLSSQAALNFSIAYNNQKFTDKNAFVSNRQNQEVEGTIEYKIKHFVVGFGLTF